MALHHKDEHFTNWIHLENGKVLNRRIHRIEVQALDGRLYVLRGKQLPDAVQTSCGEGHRGEHLAQILLRPDSMRSKQELPSTDAWPTTRDVIHVALGVAGFLLARFLVVNLAHAGF